MSTEFRTMIYLISLVGRRQWEDTTMVQNSSVDYPNYGLIVRYYSNVIGLALGGYQSLLRVEVL
jgi:hypothetical protein